MINLKTLILQLIDSETDGIRIARVENESLLTIVVPREKVADAKKLPEIPPRGIYYLLDEDHGVISRVYVGQTTQGIGRLEDHKVKKEFWNKAVMFLTDNQNLAQDVLNGLEAKAIAYVQKHGSYETENTDLPTPYVSPYSEATIESLHRDILFRMAALGYDLNRVDRGPTSGASSLFHTKKRGIHASGRYNKNTGTFTVLSNSTIDLDCPIIKNTPASQAREDLFGDKTGMITLEQDLEFSSPSAAAVFVLGGSQNGWTEWVNDEGKTLNDVYRSEE